MTTVTQRVHEKIQRLLESEEPGVRRFILAAIAHAQDPSLTKEGLAQKLRRELIHAWEEAEHANSEA